ncbi:hypothetical protein ACTXT7_014833 [Hymenolepis weldensis]
MNYVGEWRTANQRGPNCLFGVQRGRGSTQYSETGIAATGISAVATASTLPGAITAAFKVYCRNLPGTTQPYELKSLKCSTSSYAVLYYLMDYNEAAQLVHFFEDAYINSCL